MKIRALLESLMLYRPYKYLQIYSAPDWLAKTWPSVLHQGGWCVSVNSESIMKAAEMSRLPWGIVADGDSKICVGARYVARMSPLLGDICNAKGYVIYVFYNESSRELSESLYETLNRLSAFLVTETCLT